MEDTQIFFYCSSLRGNGYTLTFAQPGDYRLQTVSDYFHKTVTNYMVSQSADLFLYCAGKYNYLGIKNIKTAPNKFDSSGAAISINVVFRSQDTAFIQKLCYSILQNFTAFQKQMDDAYNFDNDCFGVGYSFDLQKIYGYLKHLPDIHLQFRQLPSTIQKALQPMHLCDALAFLRKYNLAGQEVPIAQLSIPKETFAENFRELPRFLIDDSFRKSDVEDSDGDLNCYLASSEGKNGKKKIPSFKLWILLLALIILVLVILFIKLYN